MHVHRYGHARAQIGHARAWIGHALAWIGHARAHIIVHPVTQIACACALIGHSWIDHAQPVIHLHTCRTHEVRALHDIHGLQCTCIIHCMPTSVLFEG